MWWRSPRSMQGLWDQGSILRRKWRQPYMLMSAVTSKLNSELRHFDKWELARLTQIRRFIFSDSLWIAAAGGRRNASRILSPIGRKTNGTYNLSRTFPWKSTAPYAENVGSTVRIAKNMGQIYSPTAFQYSCNRSWSPLCSFRSVWLSGAYYCSEIA